MKNHTIAPAMLLSFAALASAQVSVTNLGAASPPTSLDGYNMSPVPRDDRALFEAYDSIDLGGGVPMSLEFRLTHFLVPDQGWRPWSHDYGGSVYFLDPGQGTSLRCRPRGDIKAIIVYVDPRSDREHEFEITGLAASGESQSTRAVIAGGQAQGFGISVPDTDSIIQITINNTDRDAGGFVIGQFLRDDGPADDCYADFDGDGTLTIFDFLAYQNAFDAGDRAADCDDDGTLTIFDFLCFQNEFDAGCP